MEIKEKFLNYVGSENNLSGYVRSYKLILFKYLFELVDSEGKVSVVEVARKFKSFYEDRKSKGLITDINVDPRIQNIGNSSIKQVISVIKDNPYKSIKENGYIDIKTLNGEEYFYINEELLKKLSAEDKKQINSLLDKKIKFYFDTRVDNGVNSMNNANSLKEYFEIILENYNKARTTESFAGNPIGNLIRKDVPSLISSFNFIDTYKFKIQGSCGQGNWAAVPWIAIMNKNITNTTQKGVYIVYLFSKDMQNVCLTLNQGCTKLNQDRGRKGAIKAMLEKSASVHEKIDGEGFKSDNNLIFGNEFYEKGTIFYKEYKADQIPNEDTIIDDLHKMMNIYEEYYKIFGNDNNSDDGGGAEEIIEEVNINEEIQRIIAYIKNAGYTYEEELIQNIYLSLKSKPFLLLAGTSGTGKSKVVRLFAEALGANSINERYKLIPVKPDWSDSTDLLGYRDLNGSFHPGILTSFIKKAIEHKDQPYFVCLDEMNLARVEYYFSDILSIMETRNWNGEEIVTDLLLSEECFGNDSESKEIYKDLYLPENLYIVGTVNMDETTFPFSKKVLDRANTIEFSYVNLEPNFSAKEDIPAINLHNSFLKSQFIILDDCEDYDEILNTTISVLKEINDALYKVNLHFGYRIRDEICYYMTYNDINNIMSYEKALDYQILQKILPRIQGSNMSIKRALIDLFKICINNQVGNFNYDNIGVNEDMFKYIEDNPNIIYKKSALKIAFMMRRFEEDGFTSYWL